MKDFWIVGVITEIQIRHLRKQAKDLVLPGPTCSVKLRTDRMWEMFAAP
jgi:hypothetical protein